MAEEDKQVEEEEEIPHAAPVRVLPKPRIAPPKVGSKRRILVAGAVVGVLIVVAGVIAAVLLVGGGGSSAHGGATARAALVDVAGTAGAPGCVERHDGATVTGAGAGGANSGPDAIMWFQHSYYVERSATRARQLVAPGSPVPQADQIQKGIDSVPTGTTYCLQITALAGGKFGVALTEYRPGRTAVEYRQTVSTTVVAGRTMITGIASG